MFLGVEEQVDQITGEGLVELFAFSARTMQQCQDLELQASQVEQVVVNELVDEEGALKYADASDVPDEIIRRFGGMAIGARIMRIDSNILKDRYYEERDDPFNYDGLRVRISTIAKGIAPIAVMAPTTYDDVPFGEDEKRYLKRYITNSVGTISFGTWRTERDNTKLERLASGVLTLKHPEGRIIKHSSLKTNDVQVINPITCEPQVKITILEQPTSR